MNVFRSALSACVLSGLDHIRNLITFARKQTVNERKVKTNPVININPATVIVPVGTLSAAVGALSAAIDQIVTNT